MEKTAVSQEPNPKDKKREREGKYARVKYF
jgi:hypothetical protein